MAETDNLLVKIGKAVVGTIAEIPNTSENVKQMFRSHRRAAGEHETLAEKKRKKQGPTGVAELLASRRKKMEEIDNQ